MSSSEVRVRPMADRDITAGMDLVRVAGWNQTEADWRRFLDAGTEGCFVAETEGEVCGTVATIVYGKHLAWIGMVLVNPRRRGRGIGRELVGRALEHLDSLGPLTIKLDATPQGKPVYERLGFEPEAEIERWIRTVPPRPRRRAKQTAIDGSGLENILAMDPKIFGAGRNALLRSLHQDAPEFTTVVSKAGTLAGYTLGRHGLHADHLGPWIGQNPDVAATLLKRFLDHSTRGHVIADCFRSHPFASGLLRTAGFEFSRPLTRMVRGTGHGAASIEVVCAILGPEFG
jgi:GNAT superfamily N-acetyltransferase